MLWKKSFWKWYADIKRNIKITKNGKTDHISELKSKGSHNPIKVLILLLHLISLAALLSYFANKTVKFDGSCLKQDKTTFTHGKTVNI